MYVLLDLIYYVFFIVLQYREIPHQTPLMPHKTPTVSCDLQSCNRHATIQRFIVTACSDTGFISPHGRSGSWYIGVNASASNVSPLLLHSS